MVLKEVIKLLIEERKMVRRNWVNSGLVLVVQLFCVLFHRLLQNGRTTACFRGGCTMGRDLSVP